MTVTGHHDESMVDRLRGYCVTQLLYVAAKLGIADRLANGALTATALAALVGAHAGALARVLRVLVSEGLLSQDATGHFSLTAAGQVLRSDVKDSVHPVAALYGESWWWQAWGGLLDTVRTGGTAFDRVHGTGVFEYLAAHPSAATAFNAGMQSMTGSHAAAITAAIDLSTATRVIDVGGGHGAFAAEMLRRNPQLNVTIFDHPAVLQGADLELTRLGLRERCSLEGGDFFVSVPGGGDVYTLKDIIHDWDDDRSVAILKNVRDGLTGSARVLLIERVIPPRDIPSATALVDISMLVLTGGQERREAEYAQILSAAGLTMRRVTPVAFGKSVIEAEAAG